MLLIVKCLFVLIQTILFPLNLVLFLIFTIFTGAVLVISKIFHNFAYVIPGSSQVFLGDRFWTRPFGSILTAVEVHRDTSLTREVLAEEFEKIYNMRDAEGERCYKELGYYPVKYYECGFWADVEEFKIIDQIHYVAKELMEEPIPCIVEKLMRMPYGEGRPLWDIYILPQHEDSDKKNILFMRFHHLMADGMSIVKLCYCLFGANHLPEGFTKAKTSMQRWNHLSQSPFAKVTALLHMLTVGVIDYLDQFLFSTDRHRLNYDEQGKVRIKGEWMCSMGKKLDVAEVKQASKKLQCSIIHVVLAGITRGYERYFEKYHVTKRDPLPDKIHFVFPLPLPKHPDLRLVNHWAIGRLEAKLGLPTTIDKIAHYKAETQNAANSVLPLISTFMFRYATPILPTCVENLLSKTKATCTALLSNVVGPQGEVKLAGGNITDLMFWMPIVQETSAMSIGIISCNGGMRICLVGDVGCIPDRSHLEDFGEMINEGILEICDNGNDL